jgi:hypothetical protein
LANAFAPGIVGAIAPAVPAAGEYTMSLTMKFVAFRTMEMRVEKSLKGAMRLTLAPDGSAQAFMGARSRDVVNGQPRYQSAGKREYRESEDVRLIAHVGTWKVVDGVAVVTFERTAWTSWDVDKATSPSTTQLRCIAFGPTERVPVASIACEASEGGELLELGMPMSSPASPPPRAQNAPRGRHLVLAASGIRVDVDQDRRAAQPSFTFKAETVKLVEADYRAAIDGAKAKR